MMPGDDGTVTIHCPICKRALGQAGQGLEFCFYCPVCDGYVTFTRAAGGPASPASATL